MLLVKPIQNPPVWPCLDWIKSGQKCYEGRLANKIAEWKLAVGQQIKFYDQDKPDSWVLVEVTGWQQFPDFGAAYDALGTQLLPVLTRSEVIAQYNHCYHYLEETISPNLSSAMILDHGAVAIGIKVLDQH